MPEEEVTAANRDARRHPPKIRQIVKALEAAPPFEPHSIGTVDVGELRQLKIRATIIERLEREQESLGYELQLLRVESRDYVTGLGQKHGCPVGGQVAIDSETGDIMLTSFTPQPELVPDEVAEVVAQPVEPPLEE